MQFHMKTQSSQKLVKMYLSTFFYNLKYNFYNFSPQNKIIYKKSL